MFQVSFRWAKGISKGFKLINKIILIKSETKEWKIINYDQINSYEKIAISLLEFAFD